MDYKKTLNLPSTTFPMKANLTQNEPERLKKWAASGLFEKMKEENKDRPLFHLHDGPPYANGHIHIGHAVNKILKDIVIKYYYKEGYRTPYIPGWDCHGLPIELQTEKDLKKGKKDFSKAEIRKHCRTYAEKFVNIQKEEFKRLGILGEWDDPYITMAFDYQANIVREFGNFVKQGVVYRGKKPVYWCTSCVTALAEAEVEYDDHTSPSIYVKFPVRTNLAGVVPELAGKRVSIVIWTTTPWTLPANKAVALHPEYDYVALEEGGEVLIVAKELHLAFAKMTGREYRVIAEFKGEKLKGASCEHPLESWDSIVLMADFVTLDTGTGCVHIAPGHGQDDYELGLKNGIEVYAPVDSRGNFEKNVNYFAGKNVAKVNPEIIEKLKELGKLLGSAEISHSYPHCWRCKKPVIFRAEEQWFVSMEKNGLRKTALREIDKVRWIPQWGRDRIYNMIENRPDWCISRQRAWGVPIIAFVCGDCGETLLDVDVIGKTADLFEKHGADIWFEKDAAFFLGEKGKCAKCGSANLGKEEDILDVWFDSGVSYSYLRSRYGHELPVDMYLEGSDQHRGWFHSSLLASCTAYDQAPYRLVLTHGFVVDADGRKMSKSMGNVISPQEVISKYGAEVLRIWVSSEDYKEDIRISNEILSRLVDAYRRVRNTFKYMLSVLRFDQNDFDPARHRLPYGKLSALDRVMLHRFYKLNEKVRSAYRNYEFHTVFHAMHNFCSVDLSSIYLDISKDRIYVLNADDQRRKATQTVVYEMFRQMVLLLTPVLSFTCDEAWEHFVMEGKKESVLLEQLAELPAEWNDPALNEKFEALLDIREEVQKSLEDARRRKIIGLSLDAKVTLYIGEELTQPLEAFYSELREILIVSQLIIRKEGKGYYKAERLPLSIDVEKAEGGKCERCWVYDQTVGDDGDHPTLCKRCTDTVNAQI